MADTDDNAAKPGAAPRVEMWTLDRLHPYANNPRRNDDAVPALAESIATFGFKVPIVARPDGEILAGHTRFKAALRLGLKEVPVLVADDLDDMKAKAFRLADNKVSEAAEWDLSKLEEELVELQDADFDMEVFGFDPIEEEGETDEDAVPESGEDEPTVSVAGEVYRLGEHLLYCGSCADGTLAKLTEEFGKAICVVTDPPYGVSVGTKNKRINEASGKGERIEQDIANDTLKGDELATFLGECFAAITEAVDDEASFYIFSPAGDDLTAIFHNGMRAAGLPLRHCIVWSKNHTTFSLGRLDYDYQCESIHYTWRGTHRRSSRRGDFNSSVWHVDKPLHSNLHPTMKPVALYINAYLNSSEKGEVVLEPFGGSGTAYIAAEKTGRKCIGSEIDPHYCDVIRRRWAEFVHGEGCDWQTLTPAR